MSQIINRPYYFYNQPHTQQLESSRMAWQGVHADDDNNKFEYVVRGFNTHPVNLVQSLVVVPTAFHTGP